MTSGLRGLKVEQTLAHGAFRFVSTLWKEEGTTAQLYNHTATLIWLRGRPVCLRVVASVVLQRDRMSFKGHAMPSSAQQPKTVGLSRSLGASAQP